MDRDASFLILEHRDEFEAGAEGLEVLAERGDADVLGVLELGDGALSDVEPAGELGLADGLGVAAQRRTDCP